MSLKKSGRIIIDIFNIDDELSGITIALTHVVNGFDGKIVTSGDFAIKGGWIGLFDGYDSAYGIEMKSDREKIV